MNYAEISDHASALYGGGWRAADAEDIWNEYDYTEDERDEFDAVIEMLAEYEAEEAEAED